MPEVGQIARACDVSSRKDYHKVIWQPCEACGTPRWVDLVRGKPRYRWCYPCGRREGKKRGSQAREKNPGWKGGRSVTKGGYVRVKPPLDDPFMVMADSRGGIYEHRLVMARHLGRPLETEEQVHHKNGDKADNRIENLELTTLSEHIAGHHQEVHKLRARVKELERELREARGP